jgi:selenocysteine lyase/cysteine desulfurase
VALCVRTGGGNDRVRNFITSHDVELAESRGLQELVVQAHDVVTSVARERASRSGVRIVVAGAPAGGPASAAPAPFQARPSATLDRPALAAARPAYDLEAWRRRFPILQQFVHTANCSQSPQSDDTRNAALSYLDSWNQMGMDWDRWVEEVRLTKAEFARLINADVSEIAIGTSVSELTSAVASSLPLTGDRRKIVVTDAEFPTVGHVWLAHRKYGATVQFLPLGGDGIDLDEYRRHVDRTTLVTSICDVYYYNGFKQDLAAIIPLIHAQGSLVFLDAYQGIGTHPIDVKALDVDFLAAGNLKYLLGVPGVAFLYVKPGLVPHLSPAVTGWFGQRNPFAFDIHNFEYAPDARRFDNGTPPVLTAYIARAGMRIINEVGVERIEQWTDCLSARCLEGAAARGLEVASPSEVGRKAPTTAIRVPGSSHDVELKLRDRQVIASARSDVVRIAPHFFTRLEDIDYVLDQFVQVLRR